MWRTLLLVAILSISHHCFQFRQEIFSAEYIEDINVVADTWMAGHNFPINTTRAELSFLIDLTEYTTKLPVVKRKAGGRLTRYTSYSHNFKQSKIPKTFDARKKWPRCPDIGKIYDQGACASSYAFSVAPAFSDRRCILSEGKHKEPMSIEYLLSCCHSCKYDDTTRACGVGQPITAWWFLKKRGVVTGGEYGSKQGCQPVSFPPCQRTYSENGSSCTDQAVPNLRCHTRCTNEAYSVPYTQDRHKGRVQYWVKPDVTSIQQEILNNGPVTVQITAYEDFLHYKKGVYHHVKGGRFEHQHTLKLIGWGLEEGTPYWLLINSWGKAWGDQGTVKILQGKAECNLEYYVTAAMPKQDW